MKFGSRKGAFSGRRTRRGLLNHKMLLGVGVAALAALFLLGQFGESGVASFWKLRSEEAQLRQEVSRLQADNAELEARLEALAKNPEALEKLAREKHNMRQPDEEVLTVLDRSEESGPDHD